MGRGAHQQSMIRQHSKCYPSEEAALRRRIKNTQLASQMGLEAQSKEGQGGWLLGCANHLRGTVEGTARGSAHTETWVKSLQLSAFSRERGFSLRLSFLSVKWVNNPDLPGRLLDSGKTGNHSTASASVKLFPSSSLGRWEFLLVFGAV